MMVDYINSHMSGFWIALGFLLLATEVLLFGFTTIVFLFSGIGALVTGLAMMLGILDQTWIAGVACFGISTGVVSAILWKPLRKMQDGGQSPQKQSSDLIGYQFVLQQDISLTSPGQHRYSGVDWRVELEPDAKGQLNAGNRVIVTSVDAGVFRVKPF